MRTRNHLTHLMAYMLLAIMLSGCVGSRYNNTDDTGELRHLTSLKELQGTYANQALDHNDAGTKPDTTTPLSYKLLNYWVDTNLIPATFRITYINDKQLHFAAFNTQGALVQQKTITSPQDFIFRDGWLVMDERTVDSDKGTDYSKKTLVSYSLNDTGNLVYHGEVTGAGMYLYVFPGYTRVRIHYEYQRLSH